MKRGTRRQPVGHDQWLVRDDIERKGAWCAIAMRLRRELSHSPAARPKATRAQPPPIAPDGRHPPQEFRHGINTPSLRGVNVQRLFGSQRALKTVEGFTDFDGDPVIAMKKGVNILDRGSQVQAMAPSGAFRGLSRNIYVTDFGNNAIRKVDNNGIIKTILRRGFGVCNTTPAPAARADIGRAVGIAIDATTSQ